MILRDFRINRDVQKIIFQSDGAAQQFKQKFTLCNITLYDIPTEWHFTATSHGKSCVDGLGGSIKRKLREAIKARQCNPNSARDLATESAKLSDTIKVLYIDTSNIEQDINRLDRLWTKYDGMEINTLPKTRQFHFYACCKPYEIYYS